MNLSDIADILQIGFSGFAFLMAGLSYKLLRAESQQSAKPRPSLLKAISRYINYTLLMAILVIFFRLGEQALAAYAEYSMATVKREEIAVSSEAANCQGALSRLIHAESRVNPDYESLLLAVQQGASNCNNILSLLSE